MKMNFKRFFSKSLSVLLSLLMVLYLLPLNVISQTEAEVETIDLPVEEAVNTTEQEPVYVLCEDNSLRTETTKHFRMSDGSYTAVEYGKKVHFKDDNNQWQDYDNTLLFEDSRRNNDSVLSTSKNDIKIKLAYQNSNASLINISKDEYSVGLKLIGASKNSSAIKDNKENPASKSKPTIEEASKLSKYSSSVKYEDILNNTDIEYIVYGENLKENIIVKAKSDVYCYQFDLDLKELLPVLNDDGSISLVDEDTNKTEFVIPAGFMFDANGEKSNDVEYSIVKDNNKYTLTVTADANWINAEERAFPVTIDPAINKYLSSDIDDSDISNLFGSYNGDTYDKNNLCTGNHISYSYMQIYSKINTLPNLPSSSVITSAKFQLKQSYFDQYYADSLNIAARRVTSEWTESGITRINKPSVDNTVIDYKEVSANTNNTMVQFDITSLVQDWYFEGGNYGIEISPLDAYETYVIFHSSDSSAYNNNEPCYIISYQETKGIEDYWSYHTQNVGKDGVGYVNDYTGNLTFTQNLGFTGNYPFEVNLVYDGYLAGEECKDYYNVDLNKFGKGWKLTTFEMLTYDSVLGYIYVDSDGTEHYFDYNTEEGYYEDVDGIGLRISGSRVLTNINNDIVKTFNLSGQLIAVSDSNLGYDFVGSSFAISEIWKNDGTITPYIFGYNTNGYLTSITETVNNETVSFTYTNGLLSSITDVSGDIYSFSYDPTTEALVNVEDTSTDYSITYSYISTGYLNKISKIQEAVGSVAGQAMAVSYDDQKTTFRTAGKDDYLEAITPLTDLSEIDDILTVSLFDNYGRTINTYATNADGSELYGANIQSYSNTDSFASADNNVQTIATTGSGNPNLLGNSSFEFSAIWDAKTYGTSITGAINSYATANYFIGNQSMGIYVPTANSSLYGVYQTATLPAGTFTFSSYVKTVDVLGTGAVLSVYNGSNSLLAQSEAIKGTSNVDLQNGWRRISVTFTLSSTTLVYLHVGLKNATQYAYFDAVRLEKGNSYNNYNLLMNGGFEVSDPMYSWTGVNYTYDNTGTAFCGTHALKMTGSHSTAKSVSNSVAVNRPLGTDFVVSGWAKADSVKTDETRKFGIEVTVTYDLASPEIFYIPFNDENNEWQYISQAITPENTTDGDYITYIEVELIYANNCNTAYFDNISLTIVGVQNVSDEDDEDEDESTDPYPAYEIIDDIRYDYTYDSNNNITSTVISYVGTETGGYSSYNRKFYTSSTYDSDGNILTSTDERGKTTTYSYTNGEVSSITDPIGNTTHYDYTDDLLSKLWTTIGNTEVSNNFTYNDFGGIIGINHNTDSTTDLAFGFSYDIFGNLTAINMATATLVTYTYNQYNGKLTRITYANGYYEDYIYDEVDRLIAIEKNDVVKSTYKYDQESVLLEQKDVDNTTTDKYEYDEGGNLLRSYQINTTTKALKNSKELSFNTEGVQDGYTNIFDNGVSKTTSYTYNDDGNVSTLTLPSGMEYTYNYDVFGRLSYRSTTLNGSYVHMPITYGYEAGSGGTNATSHLIDNEAYGSASLFFNYNYDSNGNITSISNFYGTVAWYEYDEIGQLIRENNVKADKTYRYTYDTKGNLISKEIYDYSNLCTTSLPDLSTSDPNHISYSYDNYINQTQLTNYDGTNISYDQSGNPLNWRNGKSFSWQGRQLIGFWDNSYSIQYDFDYNAQGIRTRKYYEDWVNGGYCTTNYVLDGTKIIKETRTGTENATLYYYYDASDEIIAFDYNGTDYYYERNQLGDVKYISTSTGSKIAEYHYDAWGNIVAITDLSGNALVSGTTAYTVANANPFRYRGYYYDTETGLFYVGSRYYDPEIGRFINADDIDYLGESGTVLGYNLFAYCENNPVNLIDPDGHVPINPLGILIGGAIGATAGVLLAKLLGLSGWKKGLFIAGCTVAGAILGNFLAPYMGKLLALAKAKIATASTIIASSWQQAEQLLRKAYNGVSKAINTPLGRRIVDSLSGRFARESKYGYQGLSQFIKQEIAKDSYLISQGYKVEWHFYWSQVSNSGGPSGPLRQALINAGIKIVEHFKR